VASVGSFASAFSVASSMSFCSVGSNQSDRSLLSNQSSGSVLSSQSSHALRSSRQTGELGPWPGRVAVATLLVTGGAALVATLLVHRSELRRRLDASA